MSNCRESLRRTTEKNEAMRIGRAIGIQTLTTSVVFMILVVTVSFYWLRLDSGQARIRDDAITLRDYRLLSEVVSGWVLSSDLVFGREQPDLVLAGLQQGEQIVVLASELSREAIAQPYQETFADIIGLVEAHQSVLQQVQGIEFERLGDFYPVWDANSQEVIRLVVELGESLISASEVNGQLASQERRTFLGLIALECLLFSLIIFVLWRWATRLIVHPLGRLNADARQALHLGTRMRESKFHVDEIGVLATSINDFTQSLADRVDERTAMLRERQQQLAEEVELRKVAQAEAQDAAEKATAASKAKSQFLANMSHEFRTPLNAVIGGSQLLGMMELKDAAKEWSQTIEESGHQLLVLVDSALDLSKLKEGELELANEMFSSEGLLAHCRSVFEEHARDKALEFSLESDQQMPRQLAGDNVRIQQILTNLISNAVKFTEAGQVSVNVSTVRINAERVQLHWEISDTGEGIPEDSLERIFESFEQVDNSDSRKHGGSGLGLTVSRELARLMGGDVSVQSELGKGSTFRCFLALRTCKSYLAKNHQPDLAEQVA